MSEIAVTPLGPNNRWRLDWLLPTLLQPRRTFARIAEAEIAVWQLPVAILALTGLIRTLVAGGIKGAAAAMGQLQLPPGWEYYTPEQQAQFQQAMSATSGPVFTYLLPAVMTILGVYLGWLLLGWVLHLLLTLFGGRGSSQQTLNVTAWALLPVAIRDLIRILAMWTSGQFLTMPGLSGFAPLGEGTGPVVLASLLALVDIYIIWQIVLLALGSGLVANLPRWKTWSAVGLAMLLALALRAAPAVLAFQFSDLTVIRPFY
ncbi:MAG: YIP1 family protein [Anaerolineales bacterium]|nr:YIP1 family protein [Anaerolineales bacterium]